MKTHAIILESQGGPEVMQLKTIEIAEPSEGEILIEQTAIGLNYMDVYQRSGYYKMQTPMHLGLEAAGTVIKLGSGVTHLNVGDRVCYGPILGAYAKHRLLPAARAVKIPETVSDKLAAAILMKGMTVEYLLCRTYRVQAGETVLFYAASGGVGHLAGQWGKHIGATMIGVTSGPENCASILKFGYDYALDRKSDNIAQRVHEITDGKGVPVLYDSVGRDSFQASLNSLSPRGFFISFGATTGEAPAVTPSQLQHNGSLYFCRPSLANYVGTTEELQMSANTVFALLVDGVLDVSIDREESLSNIIELHRDLEAGITTGSTIIIP
ncbi:MAG: zinc-binding dehydrogenase [Alphaproteobacteria bacterium]|nr:zinc-binding dehydrogenase [Alphaproteobacteria bacterium]